MEMMPGELINWLLNRFEALNIPVQCLPEDFDICQGICNKFEQLLQGHLWESAWYQLKMIHLLGDIDKQLNFTQTMMSHKLEERLKYYLHEELSTNSYAGVLEIIVKEFFQNFMQENCIKIQDLLQLHLNQTREDNKNEPG